MERCGKINASNSGSESWTGIGVVAGFGAVVLIMQWPHRRNREVTWRSELLQILQEVRGNSKTRNQLNDLHRSSRMEKLSRGGEKRTAVWVAHPEERRSDEVAAPPVCAPRVVPHRWVVLDRYNPVG